jgi:membrane carboxypeptidase/penicillin-binding protein
MKQQLRPNRNITMGDRGEEAVRTEFTHREKREAFRASVEAIKVRMRDWTDDFVKKVYFENQIPAWHEAARETLNERKVPRQEIPKCPQPQRKKKKSRWKEKLTKSERRALHESKRLDAQFKNID